MPATIILSDEETELIHGLLEKCLGELHEEIHHASLSEYKDQLKEEEAILKGVLARFAVRV